MIFFRVFAVSALFVMAATEKSSAQSPAQSRMLGQSGRVLSSPDDLPAGRFQESVRRLPPQARAHAVGWLNRMSFPPEDVDSLNTDSEGGIFYTCYTPITKIPATFLPPVHPAAAVPVSPFPDALKFSSRPGAPNSLFLDFDGHVVSGTAWNSAYSNASFNARAMSFDADYATYSDAEQAAIKRIWQRIVEDFAGFNVNVTTVQPDSFNSRTGRLLITGKVDANGNFNPAGASAGGIAYVGVFNLSSYVSTYSPAWVYHDNLGNNEADIAEAASHEFGHNLNLSHDGQTGGVEYYGGHGTGDTSWGPLMGSGYNRNVSQWSKGDYYLANNTQNDLSIIAGFLSYLTDDHANTNSTATPLVVLPNGMLVTSTLETDINNVTNYNKGVLGRTNDVDVFSFTTSGGEVKLYVNPWRSPAYTLGGNTDLRVRLFNAATNVVADVNPVNNTFAHIVTNLSAGAYTVHISGTGVGDPLSATPSGYTVYGSQGQYFITGQVAVLSLGDISLAGNLAFGDVLTGQTASRVLTIYNQNANSVAVTNIVYPSGFSGAWTGAIPAGASRDIAVTFAPPANASYGTNLTIWFSGDGSISRAISGRGANALALSITNPAGNVSVANEVTNVTFRGVAGTGLTGLFSWSNTATSASGQIAAATNWQVATVNLIPGTNTFFINATNTPEGSVIASDSAADALYIGGWNNGIDGGSGFHPWNLLASTGNAGHFRATTAANPNLNIPSPAWAMYAFNGGLAEASRPLECPLRVGETFQVVMENNWIATGSSVGVALLNQDNEYLFEFYFTGGESSYRIGDSSNAFQTSLGYTDSGVTLRLTRTGTDTYNLTANSLTLNGRSFANRNDKEITRFRAWNFNATGNDSNNGGSYDFFFNSLAVTSVPSASVSTSAMVQVSRQIGAPGAPASVWVSATNTTSLTAAWSPVEIATSYQLDVHTSPAFSGSFVPGYSNRSVGATSQIITGLTAGVTYHLRVRALNETGTSMNSPVASATTLLPQTITFVTIADQLVTNVVGLAATASSGLPLTFSVSGPAALNAGTNLSFSATGVVAVVASQAGSTNYAAAPSVTNTFNVLPLPPPVMRIAPSNNQSIALNAGTSTNVELRIINQGAGALNWTIDTTTFDFRDNMEQDTNGWIVSGVNATWHLSTNRAYSGSRAWYCGTPGTSTHTNSMEAFAELPWVHLHTNAPSLRFRHWGDIEQDTPTIAWDGGLFGVIDQHGDLYLPVATNAYTHRWYYNTNILVFSGAFDWKESVIDLSAFAGEPVKPVFVYLADEFVEEEGWYIDDVAISPREQGDDWLLINPISGNLNGSSTADVAITVSAAALGAGAKRSADITVSGNDPLSPSQTLRIDLAVNKDVASVWLTNLTHIFTGDPKPVIGSTSPTGLLVNITYDGGATPPSALGNYMVIGEINSGIYEGATTATLSIVNLEGAIAVEDSLDDPDDLMMAFGEVDLGNVITGNIIIRNTNTTHDLTVTDIRLAGAGVAPIAAATSSTFTRTMKPRPSARELRAAALQSAVAREPDSIVVKFKPDAATSSLRAALHARFGSRPVRSFNLLPADVVKLPAGQTVNDAIAAYESNDVVEYAEPNFIYSVNAAPNDPAFTNLWGLNNTGQSGGTAGADISALDAWAMTTGSTNVIVAVIDTGIDYNHPDLAGNMWVNPGPAFGDIHGARFISGDGEPTSGDPMDDHGHGTHVAGTIGAVGNNGIGVAGVNWRVRLMALKFITSANQGSLADAIACIEYAIEHGAHLSNNSWGGGGYSQALKDAIDAAARANQLFVAAAGNDNVNNDAELFYPASFESPNIISVASSTRTDARSSFSNYGTNTVHLAAPGSAILSTWPGNSYLSLDGTSMASPHVAGVAALLLARHPYAPYADVRRWILDSVDVLPGWSNLVQTSGRLNAAAALQDAQFGVSVTNGWPIVIPPGGSVTLPVRYLPTRQEDAVDTIVISNNDALSPRFEISLSGRGMRTQSIDFPLIANQLATNIVMLSATSTSGGDVTFVASSPSVLTGNQLVFTNSGEVTVIASQAGSTYWRAAAPVTNRFMVNKVDQTVSFSISPSWRHVANEIQLAAAASSGLAVDFSVVSGPGLISSNTLSFGAPGEVIIAANQSGNGIWNVAPQATVTLNIYEDVNTNTVPDGWEAQYFPTGYVVTAQSDADGDGQTDAREFIAGTDPANAADALKLQTGNSAPAPGTNAFVFRWSSVSDRYYSIVQKTNLLDAFTPVVSGLPGTPPVNSYTTTLPAAESPMYYRIGVSLDP